MLRKLLSPLLIVSIVLSGCDKPANKNKWQPVSPTDSRILAESLEDVSKEHLEIMYKQFSGIAEYTKNAKTSFKDVLTVEETIIRFQSDYGYSAGMYPKFSSAFQQYMNSKGYTTGDDAKEVVDVVTDPEKQISKSKLILDMQVISDGIRLAMEKKNAESK